MRARKRKIGALICSAVLCAGCFSSARAEFSPRMAALDKETGVTLTLSAQAESLKPLSASSLETVNRFLADAALTLAARETEQGLLTRAEWTSGGETVFALTRQDRRNGTLTVFSPSGGAYLTAPGGRDALALLTGTEWEIPDWTGLPGAYRRLAPALYDQLKAYAEPRLTREGTSIKNAQSAAAYETYLLKGGAMNEAWPDVVKTLLPIVSETLAGQSAEYARTETLLRALEFAGDLRVKRFLDKEGGDMGLQVTGQAGLPGDLRKVTLFGGFTMGRGGYLSLALPAVSGKNTLRLTLGGKLTEKNNTRTLSIEGSYSRNQDGRATAASLEASFKNVMQDGSETWSGKATLAITENKRKTTWTAVPRLTFTDAGLSGAVNVQKKEGSALSIQAALQVSLTPGAHIALPEGTATRDLRWTSESKAQAAVAGELPALSRLVAGWMARLPEEERVLLTHDLRTDAWMNGPAAPVPAQDANEYPENLWSVEEEETP